MTACQHSRPPGPRVSGQLHGGTLDDVGGRIVGGELRRGAVLTLDRLSHEYAVSVSVAREVVRVLESMGMVTLTAPGRA